MEHLDLAGVLNTPTLWNMPAFDQQDAIYLSSSRQMLEPILEETSEDEEHAQNSWNQYEQSREHFWSSTESETGSVIRIEINKDPDSISERDFACPAKRARRSDEFIIGGQLAAATQSVTQHHNTLTPMAGSYDDTVLLRRTQRPFDYNEANSNSLERFLAYEACTCDSWGQQSQPVLPQRNSTGSKRFDEYCDSDSISYNSLSRSSSLIQFESLERQLQLQEQHASMSSLGNSSPSLLSFDGTRSNGTLNSAEDGMRSGGNSGSNSGNNSRRGSQSSLLKRFESSDGRLHQTYFDLDKLNFDDDQRVLFGANKTNLMEATVGEVRSDSESSTSSGSSSGNSILTTSKPSAEDLTDSSCTAGTRAGRIMAFQRAGKSSAENLSEDSGYCEPSTLRRTKSKSIPKNFEKFCEEEEEFQQYECAMESHEAEDVDSLPKTTNQQQQQQIHSKNIINNHNNINCDVASTKCYDVGHDDICQPKINDATLVVVTAESETYFNAATTTSSQTPPPLSQAYKSNENAHKNVEENECDADDFYEEHNIDTEDIGTSNVLGCPRFERVKNSPTRDYTIAAIIHEQQRRSFAHSPSPVASEISTSSATSSASASSSSGSSCGTARSNTSASTCASAASFTWLPTQWQLQQQQQQHQLQLQLERITTTQRQTSASTAKLELLAAAQQQKRTTLENFCASLRNSLPDIREALSTTTTCNSTFIETNFPLLTEENNGGDVNNVKGYTLEDVRNETKIAEGELLNTERSVECSAITSTYNLDDSDFSATSPVASASVSSARESHSDETDNEESTLSEARKKQPGCISGGVSERSGVGGGYVRYVSSGRRISSVPSELHKLGRKKRVSSRYRQSKSSPEENETSITTSGSSSSIDKAEDEDFFDVATSLKIRRSCSWSERRERNLQRFEAAFNNRTQGDGNNKHWTTQSLGYMNASYQDLTQLDYSGKKREASTQQTNEVITNLKRCSNYNNDSDNMDTPPKSTANIDYEHIICKGNFLLDELSQIYDRNASILTDKPLNSVDLLPFPTAEDFADHPSCSPRPPPRQRKHSHSSYSDLDSCAGSVDCAAAAVEKISAEGVEGVKHVQLTIRKPPARQKHTRKSETTHSLTSDTELFETSVTPTTNTTSVAYGKTFDQDPTNLRTSYAQSLEKCNFDAKELSETELNKPNAIPKRRFHSQANATNQRNMVASTPNLNAYDPHADEVEDDIYVSSAHTSMHQLPQATTQKPLGILLPAGSRTSFNKEVSFCPVVSQYSWQEQSSEEYNEKHEQQLEEEQTEGDEKQDDETDDELLDNADATVIQNTRVNEMIAARYAAELKSALVRAMPIEKVRELIVLKERQAAEEQERENVCLQENNVVVNEECAEQVENNIGKTSHKATAYSAETKGEALKLDSNTIDIKVATTTTTLDNSRMCAVDTSNSNFSHKPTIIDKATNVVEAEQIKTVIHNKINNIYKVENDNVNDANAQSNRNRNCNANEGDCVGGGGSALNTNNNINVTEQKRPLSLHLPILSEPPINRAHHILYASQQLLDNFERRESEQFAYQNNEIKCQSALGDSAGAGGLGGVVGVNDRRAKSVNNLNITQSATRYKMSNNTTMGGMSGQSGSDKGGGSNALVANNNNDLLNKKFKDEKHPSSKGFLSRFAHGLRFSLRRKNKKQMQQQQQQQQRDEQGDYEARADKSTMRKSFGKSLTMPQLKQTQQQQIQQTQQQQLTTADSKSKRKCAQSGPDYIYIPLKGPIPPAGTQPPPSTTATTTHANGGNSNATTLPANFSLNDAEIGANEEQIPAQNEQHQQHYNHNNNNNNNQNAIINSNRSGSDKSDMRAITNINGEPLVTGKPPKPYRYGSIPATTTNTTIITKYFGSGRRREGSGGTPTHAQKNNGNNSIPNTANFKSRSQFYTDFLDAERSYYDDDEIEKQLNANLQMNGSAIPITDDNAKYINRNALNNTTNVSDVEQKQNSDTANITITRDYLVEFETPSTAKQLAQIAYSSSTPGVARETVMLLTTGGCGTTDSGVINVAKQNSTDIAPTYTTMSNAYMQNATHNNNSNNKIGLIETNLDTHETVISGKTRSLVDIVTSQHNNQKQQYADIVGAGGVVGGGGAGGGGGSSGVAKRLNMSAACGGNMDLDGDFDEENMHVYGHDVVGRGGAVVIKSTTANGSQIASVRRPHKSMEFLLDKENQKNVLPPENELQKSHEHNPAALSEHQLRVQASLQRLNIPDWFRQYNQNTSRSPEGGNTSTVYKPGNFTRKRTTESGRWAGLNSKTTSLNSLGSQRSDRSPLLLSPSAHSHHGGQVGHQQQQHQHGIAANTSVYSTSSGGGGGTGASAFSRWSTSHLNSSQTSPSVSQRGSFTRGGPINSSFISVASGQSSVIRSSYRQPYLGWRSQEKLSQRTPHERLASSLLAQQQRTTPTQRSTNVTTNGDNGKLQPVTPEIQSSIKEVTSAIVHFVNDQTQQQQQQQRSRSTSPNSR